MCFDYNLSQEVKCRLKTLCQHNVFRFGSISDFRLWDWGCLTYSRYYLQSPSGSSRALLMLMKVWRYQIEVPELGKQAELLRGWGALTQWLWAVQGRWQETNGMTEGEEILSSCLSNRTSTGSRSDGSPDHSQGLWQVTRKLQSQAS